jgi:hypothetical protein
MVVKVEEGGEEDIAGAGGGDFLSDGGRGMRGGGCVGCGEVGRAWAVGDDPVAHGIIVACEGERLSYICGRGDKLKEFFRIDF